MLAPSWTAPPVLALALVALFQAPSARSDDPIAQAKKKAENWDALIESLASRNPKPKLVEAGLRREALFRRDYDWSDQERVLKVLDSLTSDDGEELWERLVEHADDDRYSLTMGFNGGDAINYSVGDLCSLLARKRVSFVSHHRSDPESRDRPDIFLRLGIDDLAAWRRERPEKTLYMLQVEACERAISALEKLEHVDVEVRDRIRGEIQSDIERLKKSEKPFFFRSTFDAYDFYNRENAKFINK